VNDVDASAARRAPILAKIPPPAQFALTFLVGAGLDRLMPWQPASMAMSGVHWSGFALVLAGCALAASAAGRFVLRGTTLHPTGEPTRLVVSGVHGRSRNPMYLSLTVVYVGLALALGRAWPLTAVGFDELRHNSVRGGAPAPNIRRRLRRLLSKGSALDLTRLGVCPDLQTRLHSATLAAKR
jgi:hypothetical protein